MPDKLTPKKSDNHFTMNHTALLQTLLHELQDGVIVCNADATIALFNPAAADLFGENQSISAGASLYTLCLKSPIEHALDLLRFQQKDKKRTPEKQPFVQFMNATTNHEKFFRCRLSLLPSHADISSTAWIIIFEDVSAWYRPDSLLFMKLEGFRAPMTNLRAAVENLTEHPEMSPVMRSAFENILVQESLNLTEAFDSLDQACNLMMQTQGHLTEMSSVLLFNFLANYFKSSKISFTATPEQTAVVKVDSYELLLVMDHLADKIQQERKLSELFCEAHIGEQFVYFDFIWPGEFLPTAKVEAILEEKVNNSVGELTVAAILHSMGGDIWSPQHENSRSSLRLALPLN